MKLDIVGAWKDEAYRLSLSEEQLSSLPANPVGELELTDAALLSVYGGGGGGGFPTTPHAGGPGGLGGLGGPVPIGLGHVGGAEIVNGQFISLAFECNINHFSIVNVAGVNIGTPITVICLNHSNNRDEDN